MTVASYDGPVGAPPPFPPGLGALAAVMRFVYAMGHVDDEMGRTDGERVALFAAYVVGAGPPNIPTHRRRTRR